MTAFLGANGAGKSELVLSIAGLLPVAGGEISADGKPITVQAPNLIHAAASLLSLAETKEALNRVCAPFPELAERKGQIAGPCRAASNRCSPSATPSWRGPDTY